MKALELLRQERSKIEEKRSAALEDAADGRLVLGDDAVVSGALRQLDGFERLGECTDLVHLEEKSIASLLSDGILNSVDICH